MLALYISLLDTEEQISKFEHILKFLVLPPPIMDTHMSFLVQLISNPVPLTS